MDAPMSMNRVIHSAVRRDLARLESALADAPDGDRGRAEGLGRAYAHLVEQLDRHQEGEDRWVFPMLVGLGADPILIGEMEAEHEAMHDALLATEAAVTAYTSTASAEAARGARKSVAHTRHVVIRHLDHEEAELEPLLRDHEDSEEWQTVQRRLRRQPLRVAGQVIAWLEDGMDPVTRGYYETAVPKPVRFVLSNVFGRGYRREIASVWKP